MVKGRVLKSGVERKDHITYRCPICEKVYEKLKDAQTCNKCGTTPYRFSEGQQVDHPSGEVEILTRVRVPAENPQSSHKNAYFGEYMDLAPTQPVEINFFESEIPIVMELSE